MNIPQNIQSKEELAAALMHLGLNKEAYDLLGKDAPRPIKLGSIQTDEVLAKFISCSPEIEKLKQLVRRWSNVDDPVLITGESGTGKELIARALHSDRKGPFVDINCAGFISNEALMDSEIFGHRKGAFTGADADHWGYIKRAENGTIFFDEIGELPLKVQSKLLRTIQERSYRPVGSNQTFQTNARFVFATHEPIEEYVKAGRFRLDLYHRISFGRLHIKPLRERPEDIPLIIRHLFAPHEVPKDFICEGILLGNVRELQQKVRQYIVERMDIRV